MQRRSKLNGAKFVQTLVFGWLNNPQASLEALSQTAATLGVNISPQALDQRFSPEAAAYLEEVIKAAVNEVVSSEPVAISVLDRFTAVVVQDSSTITLPEELKELWEGCGGSNGSGKSALKLHVGLELRRGILDGPVLSDGRSHDRKIALSVLPKGSLKIADLGYFSIKEFEELD